MGQYTKDLERYEKALVKRFRDNPNFLRAMALPNAGFEDVLLQKRYLSKHFKEIYRRAIANMQNPNLKKIAEKVLADEYLPEDHEVLLDRDLKKIGIKTKRLYETTLTETTQGTIDSAYALVTPQNDILIATGLRVFGELLVGEEYARIFPELERRYGLTKLNSKFFYPHLMHDRKLTEIGVNGKTHTDQFGLILDQLVHQEQTGVENRVRIAEQGMDAAYNVRRDFWRQF